MQMTTDARLWLDATVRRILARHPLGDPERAGITYELMSHLHAAGEAKASAAGRTEVSRGDLEAALLDAGGESALAEAFVKPLSKPLERAPLGRRAVALAIDAFLMVMGLVAVHATIEIAYRIFAGGAASTTVGGEPNLFLPWGFHDANASPLMEALYQLGSAALILGYFAWFEGHEGRTLGKRAMELRVVRVDGEPMRLREGLIRNVSRLLPPVFFFDVLLGLLVFPKERQRVSDKLAGTMVVRA